MPECPGAPAGRDVRSPSGREPPPLHAALDLGTNNCRLLVARPARDGFRVVDSFSRIVRLGEGLSRTGRLDTAAMDRAYDALAICAERLARRQIPAERLSAVATQACRAAENGPEFIARVAAGTGLKLRVIDPAEEARLSVTGCATLFDPTAAAVVVIDVGGGSTEVSWLKREPQGFTTVAWISAPLGVVSLAERLPEPDEGDAAAWYAAMVDEMAAALTAPPEAAAMRPLFEHGAAHLVGTSGAITSLAGIHLRLPRYNRDRVDGLWMTRAECDAATLKLREMGRAGRAADPCIGPDRADLVLAGAAILDAVQRGWPSERVRVADRGLREGLLLEAMKRPGRTRRRRRRAQPST